MDIIIVGYSARPQRTASGGGVKGSMIISLTDVLGKFIHETPADGLVQKNNLLATMKEIAGRDMADLYKHPVEDDTAINLPKTSKAMDSYC